jgi:hypothetical protein
LRRRHELLSVALLGALAWFVAFNVYQMAVWSLRRARDNDFKLYYGAASVGLRSGWQRIYEAALQRQAVAAAWPGKGWLPFVSPPPLAWLAAPLTLLPAPAAYAVWAFLMAACLVAASQLAAPRDGLARTLWAGLALGFLPTYVAVASGQVAALIALAVAAAWALLEREREWLAGLALLPIALKPHIAFLVPVALLAAGRWRTFAAWGAGSAFLAALSALSLGVGGLREYVALLGTVASRPDELRWSFVSLLGPGPASWAAEAAAVALALLAAWRGRRGADVLAVALSAGVLGSLLANRYLNPSDLTLLLLPIWLLARRAATPWLVAALGGLWLAGWFAVALGPPVMAMEAATLALLLAPESWRSASPRPGLTEPALIQN